LTRLLFTALLASAVLLPGATIPRPAPELTINSPNGPIPVSKYKGKVVVLEILSTTCPACQKSAGMMAKINAELGPKGLQPLGMAINPDANVSDFISKFGVNFPVGTGKRDDAYAFLQMSVMSPFYFPQMVFIDKQGVIRAQYGGTDQFIQNESNVRAMIEKLLAEGGSAKPSATPARSKKKAS
jgi:peroxiredoxin